MADMAFSCGREDFGASQYLTGAPYNPVVPRVGAASAAMPLAKRPKNLKSIAAEAVPAKERRVRRRKTLSKLSV
jgi:hypothetical protein